MDDALLVCGFKSLGDLLGYGQCLIYGNRTLRDAVRQRRPFNQFKDQRLLTLGFLQPVDVPDVGMVQRGQDFRFTLKAGEAIRIVGEGLRQDFERHVPIQFGISGPIHLAHAAFTDLGGDVVVGDARADFEGHSQYRSCRRRSAQIIRRAVSRSGPWPP